MSIETREQGWVRRERGKSSLKEPERRVESMRILTALSIRMEFKKVILKSHRQ
jgi:hypothetical protein